MQQCESRPDAGRLLANPVRRFPNRLGVPAVGGSRLAGPTRWRRYEHRATGPGVDPVLGSSVGLVSSHGCGDRRRAPGAGDSETTAGVAVLLGLVDQSDRQVGDVEL